LFGKSGQQRLPIRYQPTKGENSPRLSPNGERMLSVGENIKNAAGL
jgi:hypothetical protein